MIEFCLAVLLTGLAVVGFGFNVYIVLALLVAGQVSIVSRRGSDSISNLIKDEGVPCLHAFASAAALTFSHLIVHFPYRCIHAV